MTKINRKLTRAEQSRVYVMLAQNIEVLVPHEPLDNPKQRGVHRYLHGTTDQIIADALGLPVDVIAYRREGTYGKHETLQSELPLDHGPRLAALEAIVAQQRSEIDEVVARIESMLLIVEQMRRSRETV